MTQGNAFKDKTITCPELIVVLLRPSSYICFRSCLEPVVGFGVKNGHMVMNNKVQTVQEGVKQKSQSHSLGG